jgi:hypothetical protein
MNEQVYHDDTTISIPPLLQGKLEQDCIEIVHRKKLMSLPVIPSVEDILKDYWSHSIDMTTDETKYVSEMG